MPAGRKRPSGHARVPYTVANARPESRAYDARDPEPGAAQMLEDLGEDATKLLIKRKGQPDSNALLTLHSGKFMVRSFVGLHDHFVAMTSDLEGAHRALCTLAAHTVR